MKISHETDQARELIKTSRKIAEDARKLVEETRKLTAELRNTRKDPQYEIKTSRYPAMQAVLISGLLTIQSLVEMAR